MNGSSTSIRPMMSRMNTAGEQQSGQRATQCAPSKTKPLTQVGEDMRSLMFRFGSLHDEDVSQSASGADAEAARRTMTRPTVGKVAPISKPAPAEPMALLQRPGA